MKKIFLYIFIFFIWETSVGAALEHSAEYACVMEASTGAVVYEYNGYEKHSMASTTKIMTALLALENSKPDEMVKISTNAAYQEGSSAYLAAGEQIKMIDLLYGLMLNSGNDAAVAVAEHISGTESAFAEKMTQKAHSLGAVDTSFENASGLDDENHYTTAVDLGRITCAALLSDTFREIVSQSYKEVMYSGGTLCFSNHNKMLKRYPGCIGVKTGFTKKTGRCLVTAATRDDVTLVCVTLNAPDDWNDHTKLLDYGFDNVKNTQVVKKGQILKYISAEEDIQIPAIAGETVVLPEIKGVKNEIELILHTIPEIKESVGVGEKIGECEILFSKKEYKKIDILADTKYVRKKTFFENVIDFFKGVFKH